MIKEIYGETAAGEKVKLDLVKLFLVNDEGLEVEISLPTKHPDDLDISLYLISDETREKSRYFNVYPGSQNLLQLKIMEEPTAVFIESANKEFNR